LVLLSPSPVRRRNATDTPDCPVCWLESCSSSDCSSARHKVCLCPHLLDPFSVDARSDSLIFRRDSAPDSSACRHLTPSSSSQVGRPMKIRPLLHSQHTSTICQVVRIENSRRDSIQLNSRTH
ncbi:unnamed protein product, partial [Protopolystoma xenopodis]